MSHFAEGVPRPTKRSVAVVVRHHADPARVLLVQRPDDDEDLPGVWGLPAASLVDGETALEAALRAGREKLGVMLDVMDVLNEGAHLREAYRLEMQLLDARIVSGTPRVDVAVHEYEADGAGVRGRTRYQAWRWGVITELQEAADLGSLCSRLALEADAGT
ncbi:MAG TPA: NUDIX domain-containing protein [Longimicrobiales bacterium]|nr:NUDIX domain-containing protein [Longimicrobiales bacterium]